MPRNSTVEDKIHDASNTLEDEEVVASEMAMTNVDGAFTFECEVSQVSHGRVYFSYTFSGDQHTEKPFSGDKVYGRAEAVLDRNGDIVRFENVTAARNL